MARARALGFWLILAGACGGRAGGELVTSESRYGGGGRAGTDGSPGGSGAGAASGGGNLGSGGGWEESGGSSVGSGGTTGVGSGGSTSWGTGGSTWGSGGSTWWEAGGATAAGGGGQGGSTDWSICDPGDTCVLEPVSPCGAGCEPLSMSSYVAINSQSASDYLQHMPKVACPVQGACIPPDLADINTPSYYPACVQGRCQIIDIRTSSFSACSVNLDCYVRFGTGCCPRCDNMSLVALSTKSNAEELFCASAASCNVECAAPEAPDGNPVIAMCGTTGHCELVELHPL